MHCKYRHAALLVCSALCWTYIQCTDVYMHKSHITKSLPAGALTVCIVTIDCRAILPHVIDKKHVDLTDFYVQLEAYGTGHNAEGVQLLCTCHST